MNTDSKGGIKSIEVEAVIIRKDGTRVNLGQVAYWHKNPLRRWWNAVKQSFKGR